MESRGLTAEIAAFAAGAANLPLPAQAIAAARRAFIDTIGVILAGRREPAVATLCGLLGEGGEAFSLGAERRLSAEDAALADGMAGHVLDYDDVAQAGHPSVVLVPAILAEARRSGASGIEVLRAYAVGFETWCELARREPDAFHLGGWHPTPMLGIVAATGALAVLHRADGTTTRHALAIAASLSGGVIANFGTPMKPLHAGRAAAGAITAWRYALAGLTGAADALEAEHGFLRAISPRGRVDRDEPYRMNARPWRLVSEGLSVKRYPVCYASHRAIDGVITMAQVHDLTPRDVASVTVTLGRAPAETLRYHEPRNGLEARFSLQHNVAAALVDRAVGFAQLRDDFVRRADVAALYPLTTLRIDEGDPCPDQPGMARHDRVEIALRDGRRLDSGPLRHPRGHARDPLDEAQLAAKFRDCAQHGGYAGSEALLGRLMRLETLPRLDDLDP